MGIGTAIFSIFIITLALRLWPLTLGLITVAIPVLFLLGLGLIGFTIYDNNQQDIKRAREQQAEIQRDYNQQMQQKYEQENKKKDIEYKYKRFMNILPKLKMGTRFTNLSSEVINFLNEISNPNEKDLSFLDLNCYFVLIPEHEGYYYRIEFENDTLKSIYNNYTHKEIRK